MIQTYAFVIMLVLTCIITSLIGGFSYLFMRFLERKWPPIAYLGIIQVILILVFRPGSLFDPGHLSFFLFQLIAAGIGGRLHLMSKGVSRRGLEAAALLFASFNLTYWLYELFGRPLSIFHVEPTLSLNSVLATLYPTLTPLLLWIIQRGRATPGVERHFRAHEERVWEERG